jgi:hypothetical protein
LVLALVAGGVCAECGNGNESVLKIYSIGDRISGETVSAIIQTQWNQTNQFRELDIQLEDPYGHRFGSLMQTRFPENDNPAQVQLNFATNDNYLNGSYRIRVEMTVTDNTNQTDEICSIVRYSNNFVIRTGRVYYSELPMNFFIDTGYDLKPFSVNNQTCANNICANVNISGMMPSNFTIKRAGVFLNVTGGGEAQLSTDVNFCYSANFVASQQNVIAQLGNNTAWCTELSRNTTDCLANRASDNSKMVTMQSDSEGCKKEFTAYKDTHTYDTSTVVAVTAAISVIGTLLVIRQLMHSRGIETPHDKV